MKILSIQIGLPKEVQYHGKAVSTGIFKEQVSGPVFLRTLNLDGDGQADLTVHGGADKALYAYGYDTYPYWKALRPQDSFPFGAFGENLCIDTLPENSMYIGDTYELGDALIQVAQPRFPCQKLGIKFNDMTILKQFMKYGRPGIYFRVLKEGAIAVRDELKLIDREKTLLSVAEIFELYQQDSVDPARIQEILQVKALPAQWRRKFESWLPTN
jgi:MOSC domain-containing protein YiiM